MKTKTLFTALVLMLSADSYAQELQWDREKYPDYNPTPRFDMTTQRMMSKRVEQRKAQGQTRPDHWNNADLDAFPPVVNQSAGSCGSASRIYYMFTEEMNAARGVSGKLEENIYPTHFTWLLTWTGANGYSQGKECIAQYNGIPNSTVYGGRTYSELFGYQDCDQSTQYDYGWMQGYDKWFHAMHNRISGSANFSIPLDKEEGRELVKNYLWNHCGDNSFSAGGVVGVGVASGGTWGKIPKTAKNDELGLTGKSYVKKWGGSVDHALTIVGYDDRVEFDLDGNGVKGEADKDEVGAWIVVNSWGASWPTANDKGFIYCPYAEARPTNSTTGFWTPEYYTIRRDYRPLRTLKVKMDYSRRSEIALFVGYSTKTTATKPDKEIWLRHFYYSGLCKGFTASSSNPDPEVPMLGRWADGRLHTEPMEFGYDLTDLVADVDPATPLKFFLRVETRAWAKGEGNIYSASIVDYSVDPEGIETPFDIPAEGKAIANKGKKTTITAVARAESLPSPRNLVLDGQTLKWQAPTGNQYPVQSYQIYLNGIKTASVDGQTLQAALTEAGSYAVTATYSINDNVCESQRSQAVVLLAANPATATNDILQMNDGARITVPHFNAANANKFTIEFWLRPDQLSTTADNFGIKSSAGKFFFKVNKQKKLEVGFDGGDCKTSANGIKTDTWQHIAITANAGQLNVYVDDKAFVQFSTGWNNTVGSVGDLVLGQTEGTSTNNKQVYDAPWTGGIDELRIWSTSRTLAQIKATKDETYIYPALTQDLSYYYKMDTRTVGNDVYLIDAVAGNDARIKQPAAVVADNAGPQIPFAATASTDFTIATSSTVGQPVSLTTASAPGTIVWKWTFTGADIAESSSSNPVVVFTQAGTQTVKLVTENINGETTEKEKTITIRDVEAPQAAFSVSMTEVPAGEHVSFINESTPLSDCTYEWQTEGADRTGARTVNAAVTYPTKGTYTVRLIATNAAGSSVAEKQVEVVKVAPQSAFTIHNNVAIVGEEVTLEDQSRYEPDTWMWTVSSDQHTYYVNGRNSTFPIDRPGVYSVSLQTSNEKGQSITTRERGIIVCSTDGQTGLKFDGEDDELVAASPFGTSGTSAFGIEFWLYPGALTESCIGIGDSEATFLMRTSADGTMTVFSKNKSVQSLSGYVIPNEWHHYFITYGSQGVTWYRDGRSKWGPEKFSGGMGSTPAWSRLRLGGTEAPMNAIIDELRVWKRAFQPTAVQQSAQAPIENPAENTNLVLYYNFNQSSGDVEDLSASAIVGQRNNFGPDGDAWTSSKGIFCINFEEAEDVTATYLKNYKAPFKTGSGTVNSGSRFARLQTGTDASPWVQENSVTDGNITTEFYVDANKGKYLTLSTEWDNFAAAVDNLKLYQPVTLPEGAYTFCAQRGDWEFAPLYTKTVASLGPSLPNFDVTDTEALGWAYAGLACNFVLKAPTTVNLGLVSVQNGKTCIAIKNFLLLRTGVTIINGSEENAIREVGEEASATATLQAAGGLGCITILPAEPQYVSIYSLSGQLVWASFVETKATVRVPTGIYLVGGQKVMVR